MRCPRDTPNLFEIAVGQVAQNLGVDIILAKQRFVLLETEIPQPNRDIHPSFLRPVASMMVLRGRSVHSVGQECRLWVALTHLPHCRGTPANCALRTAGVDVKRTLWIALCVSQGGMQNLCLREARRVA